MNKKTVKLISLGLVTTFCVGMLAACNSNVPTESIQSSWDVQSPDKTLTASMELEQDGKLYYSVKKGGTEVVGKSEMGIDIEEDDFYSATLCSVNTRRVQGEYENISGKRRYVTYDCNETVITLKGWSFYFDVTMRCYDDGYAFRYGIRKIDGTSGDMTIREENTQFSIPNAQKGSIWAQEYRSTKTAGEYFSYERSYEQYRIENIDSSRQFAMPVMYRVNVNKDTYVYSMIAQSDLIGSGYYGSFLQMEGEKGSGVLKTVINPAGSAMYNDVVGYPFESPWRLGITGDLKTVEESELVEKLYDDAEYWKPDNYETLSNEEKAIYDYDWVEPGVCAWSWLYYQDGEQSDYRVGSIHYQYADLAAEMGWKYILLDGGWSSNLDEAKFRAFADYAKDKGVKIIVWCDSLSSFGKGNKETLKIVLDRYASLGISGIKPDFYDGLYAGDVDFRGEDIGMIDWYETMYQECAKRKMLVDCHGCNVPTGERRIYPNVINREAVFGNENDTVGANLTINQLLIRGVVGPTDFTPVVDPRNPSLMTPAHQLALSFLFESGLPMYGDHIEAYKNEVVYDFYKSMPSLRDETVFLDGALNQLYSAAIRSGDQWLVGSVCYFATEVTIDFSFLGDGEYTAEVYTDGNTGLQKEIITVNKTSKITKQLKENGGVIFRLVPKN